MVSRNISDIQLLVSALAEPLNGESRDGVKWNILGQFGTVVWGRYAEQNGCRGVEHYFN